MSATATPTCPLGLSADDLSAWRDQTLSAEETRRIKSHVPACDACRRVIAAHGALAFALRADEPPAPDPLNWSRLQARIATGVAPARNPAPARGPRWRRAAFWSGLSAATAALVISALFFSLFTQWAARRPVTVRPLATSTPAPTVAPVSTIAPTTPIKGTPLTWQTYAAPAAAVPPHGNASPDDAFAFAPSDARTAYVCAPLNAGGANLMGIWATHDGAHSWKQVANLPISSPHVGCVITVDALDPLRLNVLVEDASQQGSPTSRSYLSEDGGMTWRALGDGVSLYWLTTRGQTSVAVTAPGDMQGGYIPMPSRAPRLVVSHDGFHSWASIDTPLVARGLNVWSAWQRPGDGALLVMAEKRTPNPNGAVDPIVTSSLWESDDMGVSWRAFPTPANLNGIPGFIAAQPRGSDPWRVCGLTYPQGSAYLGEVIACTLDGGKTWTPRPLPTLRVLCGPTSDCTQLETIDTAATLLNNGTLLATFYTGPSSGGVMVGPFTMKAFALPAGSNHWQDLGPIPGGTFSTVDAPDAVTVVGYLGSTFTGVLGGQLGNTESGTEPYVGDFSFATLP